VVAGCSAVGVVCIYSQLITRKEKRRGNKNMLEEKLERMKLLNDDDNDDNKASPTSPFDLESSMSNPHAPEN
jgi:hypothetical protein